MDRSSPPAAAATGLVIVPIVALSTVLCYLDLRVRLEALDLELAITDRFDRVHGLSVLWDDLTTCPRQHTGAEARSAAKDVLSRPEFHRPGPSIIERIERWVSDAINRVLETISGAAGGGVIASVILVAAVALAVVMLLRFGKGVQTDGTDDPRPACAPVAAAAPRTGAPRRPNTRPQADGATACGAATARWSWSSRATACSTTFPARRPVRSEPTSQSAPDRRRARSAKPPSSSTTCGTAMRPPVLRDASAVPIAVGAVLEEADR